MYALILLAVIVVAVLAAMAMRERAATAEPTRAGSPRTPAADLMGDAATVDADEGTN